MGNVTGGDYNAGISPDAVLRLLQDALTDERQYRRLLLAAVEQLQTLIQNETETIMRLMVLTIALAVMLVLLVLLVIAIVFVRL